MRYETNHPYYQDDFLNHHGIIGMKWGKWNEETRARYLGTRRRKNSKSDEVATKVANKPKSEIGGLFNRGSKRNEDLSSLPEEEKKKIDKKYFQETTSSYQYRPKNEDGTYSKEWVTKEYKDYKIDGKALVKDLSPDFYKKIDSEKKDFLNYLKYPSAQSGELMVKALDHAWYGHDFSLNMYPMDFTYEEFKKEMNDYWAKDANFTDYQLTLLYSHMKMKTKYMDKVENICDEEVKKLGISDDMQWRASSALYGAFVDATKSNKEIVKDINRFSHSDTSSDSYYAIDSSTTVEHEGVKGMKWGVWNEETRARRLRERRRASKAGNSSVIGSKNNLLTKLTNRFSKNKTEEQPHLKRTHLTKELASISDEELNAAIKRMQLEQNYLNMLKNYPDASDKGKKYVDQFSDELFKNLSNGLGGAMGKRIAKAIDDWINDDSKNDKKYDEEVRSKSNEQIKAYNERKKIEEAYKSYRKKEDEK